MEIEKTYQGVVLAGLFHDIGKFWQRAVKEDIGLSEFTRNLEDEICPAPGSYRHVLWTSEFFERFEKVFPSNVSETFTSDATDNIKNLSSRHHRPSTALQTLIQQADWLSSGMDRTKTMDAEDESKRIFRFRKSKLRSIFSLIKISERESEYPGGSYVCNLRPLQPDETIFPEKITYEDRDLTEEYQRLWTEFIVEFEKLNEIKLKKNFNLWISSTLSLLEKYTWCIPSSTVDFPDISLYDHLKTTSAIAGALFIYHFENGTINNIESIRDQREKKFLLICGDLSGIQDFIYSLSVTNVKGASKILRARSFYLQALTEIVVHYILKELKLSPVANIINAGGRFIILAPNVQKTREKIAKLDREISKWFLTEFSGRLAINLTYDVELSGQDLMRDNFNKVIEEISVSVERKKFKKFWDLFKDGDVSFVLEDLYEALKTNGGQCEFCGFRPKEKEVIDEEGERRLICKHCDVFVNIGRWVTESVGIYFTAEKEPNAKSVQVLNGKIWLNFFDESLEEALTKKAERIIYIERFKGGEKILPVRFFANYVPRWEKEEGEKFKEVKEIERDFSEAIGQVKTFGEIAKLGTLEIKNDRIEKSGKAMLGILKGDVDNLGKIFSIGLQNNSISRYVSLSRNLDLYFNAYLGEKIERKFRNIYVVYSGGDDFLLIGEWKEIIDFALEIYKDFKKFTAQNPDITISAGISLIDPVYPINRGAVQADEFLERSKNLGKDRLTIFNTTVKWEMLNELLKWKDLFERWLISKNSEVKPAFLYRMLKYQQMAKSFYENRDYKGLRYTYLLKYDVSRNIVRRENGKIKKGKEEMEKLFELVDYNLMDNYKELWCSLNIPIYYVLYKYRGKQNIKGGRENE